MVKPGLFGVYNKFNVRIPAPVEFTANITD